MHRKDYIKAAEIVAEARAEINAAEHKRLTNYFVRLFRGDNPRFDKKKFLAACGESK